MVPMIFSRGWLLGELSILLTRIAEWFTRQAKHYEKKSINADLPDWEPSQPTGARRGGYSAD